MPNTQGMKGPKFGTIAQLKTAEQESAHYERATGEAQKPVTYDFGSGKAAGGGRTRSEAMSKLRRAVGGTKM